MSFIDIGDPSGDILYFKYPIAGTTLWASDIRDLLFLRLRDHDHSGNGLGKKLGPNAFDNDILDGSKFRLNNQQSLRSRNGAGNGDINILKVTAQDLLEIITPVQQLTLANGASIEALTAPDPGSSKLPLITAKNDASGVTMDGTVTFNEVVDGLIIKDGEALKMQNGTSVESVMRLDSNGQLQLLQHLSKIGLVAQRFLPRRPAPGDIVYINEGYPDPDFGNINPGVYLAKAASSPVSLEDQWFNLTGSGGSNFSFNNLNVGDGLYSFTSSGDNFIYGPLRKVSKTVNHNNESELTVRFVRLFTGGRDLQAGLYELNLNQNVTASAATSNSNIGFLLEDAPFSGSYLPRGSTVIVNVKANRPIKNFILRWGNNGTQRIFLPSDTNTHSFKFKVYEKYLELETELTTQIGPGTATTNNARILELTTSLEAGTFIDVEIAYNIVSKGNNAGFNVILKDTVGNNNRTIGRIAHNASNTRDIRGVATLKNIQLEGSQKNIELVSTSIETGESVTIQYLKVITKPKYSAALINRF